MAIMQFIEKFTLEIPQRDNENYVINGKLLPDTHQLKKTIKEKYKERDKKAILNQKKKNKVDRNKQKAQNIQDRLALIDDKTKRAELLEQQQMLLDEAYTLSDEIEDTIEDEIDNDIVEIVSKEHITNRVKLEDKDVQMFNSICEKYGYALVWKTITEDINEGKQKDKKS